MRAPPKPADPGDNGRAALAMLDAAALRALPADDVLQLLGRIEDVLGWPIRVLTRADADGICEGYDVPVLTDAEFDELRVTEGWKQLGYVSDADWEEFTGNVMDAVRSRPDFADLDARAETKPVTIERPCLSCRSGGDCGSAACATAYDGDA